MATTTTTQQRFNTYIPIQIGISIAYLVVAFIVFAFLFGIMKYPARDLNTLNIMQQYKYSKFQKEYRANQTKMINLEKMEYISSDGITKVTIKNIERDINNLKNENLLLNTKMSKISAQAKYKAWQYKLSHFLGWKFPFNLHKL